MPLDLIVAFDAEIDCAGGVVFVAKMNWTRVHQEKISAKEREITSLDVGGRVSLPDEHAYTIIKFKLGNAWEKSIMRKRKRAAKAAKLESEARLAAALEIIRANALADGYTEEEIDAVLSKHEKYPE